jgi:hypothetical protein
MNCRIYGNTFAQWEWHSTLRKDNGRGLLAYVVKVWMECKEFRIHVRVNFMVRDAFRKCEHKTSTGSEGDGRYLCTL